jgi:hypothetical protein
MWWYASCTSKGVPSTCATLSLTALALLAGLSSCSSTHSEVGGCRGLAGIHEIVGQERPLEMRPWLILTEEADGSCEARIGEQWCDPVVAKLLWEDDKLQVNGVPAQEGLLQDGCLYWQLDMDLTGDGAFAGSGIGTYYPAGPMEPGTLVFLWPREETTVLVADALSPTAIRFTYPERRPAALPWDGALLVEASRPAARLSMALPVLSGVAGAWETAGERTVQASLLASWDELRGLSRQIGTVAEVLDDAGYPFAQGAELSFFDVGTAVSLIQFRDLPSARWGYVAVADPAPVGCGDTGCLDVRSGWPQSGIAWQLDTQGATEARVTFAVDDGADPATFILYVTLVAMLPNGTAAPGLAEERDIANRTITRRFDTQGAERLGFELETFSEFHVISSEAW